MLAKHARQFLCKTKHFILALNKQNRSINKTFLIMVYILNTNLNSEKRVRASLQKIRGVGPFLANQVCDQVGLPAETRIKQLSFNQVDEIKSLISQSHLTGNELSRFNRRNKGRLGLIGAYRGVRQSVGLPLRGQRTHGNSKTARRLKGRNF